ncbi:MAG: PEP-CTERM sorting domain-containing protein, partial [Terriglobales bacterium]
LKSLSTAASVVDKDGNPGTAWDIRNNQMLRFPVAAENGPAQDDKIMEQKQDTSSLSAMPSKPSLQSEENMLHNNNKIGLAQFRSARQLQGATNGTTSGPEVGMDEFSSGTMENQPAAAGGSASAPTLKGINTSAPLLSSPNEADGKPAPEPETWVMLFGLAAVLGATIVIRRRKTANQT